jgi:ankyrin repeat protein
MIMDLAINRSLPYEQQLLTAVDLCNAREALNLISVIDDPIKLNKIKNTQGLTALMIASEKGTIKIVEALITSNVNVNEISKQGTALLLAAKNGHLEVVKALLAADAELDHADFTGKTAGGWAFLNGHRKILGAIQMHKMRNLPTVQRVDKSKKEESTLTWAFNYAYSILPSWPFPSAPAPKRVHEIVPGDSDTDDSDTDDEDNIGKDSFEEKKSPRTSPRKKLNG